MCGTGNADGSAIERLDYSSTGDFAGGGGGPGPAGFYFDADEDGDVDLADYAGFYACFAAGGSLGGDQDADGDVDLEDFAAWVGCLRGPGVAGGGGCAWADLDADGDVDLGDWSVWLESFGWSFAGDCGVFDLDADLDVDLYDHAGFQVCYSGEGGTPPPSCRLPTSFYHDADADLDIDLGDWANLQNCFDPSGAQAPPDCLAVHDFDAAGLADGDIDLDDYARFVECWGGPGELADRLCAPPVRGLAPTALTGDNLPPSGTFTLHGRPVDVLSDGHVLFHFRARYYDPATGRWLQRDPLPYGDGPNLYEAFCLNPLRFQDPMGTAIGDWWDPETYIFGARLTFPELERRIMGLFLDPELYPTPEARGRKLVTEAWHTCRAVELLKQRASVAPALVVMGLTDPTVRATGVYQEVTEVTVLPLGQGLVNIPQGVQNSVIGLANTGLDFAEFRSPTLFAVLRVIDPESEWRVPSPQWAQGLVIETEEWAYAGSTTLGGEAAIVLATLGAGAVAQSRAAAGEAILGSGLPSGATGAARGVPLRVLNPEFVPDPRIVLQGVVTQQNELLKGNLGSARAVFTLQEYRAGTVPSRLNAARYGQAVERLVAEQIRSDPLLSQGFDPIGILRGRGPDIVGIGPFSGRNFEITVNSPRAIAEHLGRSYGQGLIVVTYQRPPGFSVFPP